MRVQRVILALLLSALFFIPDTGVLAQDDSRQPNPNARLGVPEGVDVDRVDLAAIVLTSDDMPTGFALNAEAYTNAEVITSTLKDGPIPDALVDALDMRWYYQSEYRSADGESRIRSYAEEFGSDGAASAGFELLEDESLFAQTGVHIVDKPGYDFGEEPSEVTVSTIEASSDAPSGASIDATFRVGRLLVGVAIDTISTTPPDEELLEELAGVVAARARAVLDGEDVPGIDRGLVGQLLSFDDAISVQDGYVTLIDTVGAAAPQIALDDFVSGYLRVVALDTKATGELPLPIVTVMISNFSSESAALTMISSAQSLLPAFDELQKERLEPIPGTSAVIAFSFANPFESGSADSYRILVVVGSTLITVDVEGAGSLENAESAALALLAQQIACFESACGPAELPVEIAPANG